MRLGRLAPLALLLAVPLLVFLASSCGDEEEEAPPGAASPEVIAAEDVDELKDGTLQVGSDIAYAPIEFYKEGTQEATGVDVDLATALAEELGVKVEFVNTGFDGIIGALQAERFDVIMSSMTITEERQQEIDFIPYFTAGTGILVKVDNPDNIQTIADLCGKTVAVQVGTIQVDMLNAQNEQCTEKISINTFDQNPLAVEQLRLDRADAVLADYPVAIYDASAAELEVTGNAFESAPYGIGLRKSSPELKAAIEEALRAIMDSGKYKQVLDEWGLEAGAISTE